jgi:hypothetical protein
LDPFDEFARAIAADDTTGKFKKLKKEAPKKEAKKEAPKKEAKKKSKKEEFEKYETDYLGRLELTREEVEKARAEIEIIKIREPNRKSQKIIPTQATILNAGNQDYYVIFGIDQHITCDELKEQFRKLSVKYNSSIGMLSRTKEENEIIGKVHTRINQAYRELAKTHQC